MALTEEQLQEKRQKAADLVKQIKDEKQKQRELVLGNERETQAVIVDAEIVRLEAELAAEKELTEHQEKAVSPAVAPEDFNAGAGESNVASPPVVTPDPAKTEVDAPPAPPATVKAAKASDQK